MSDELVLSSYPVFKVARPTDGAPRELLAKEAEAFFAEWEDRVQIRGLYDTAGFTHRADLVMWLITRSADHLQGFLRGFSKTGLGDLSEQVDYFVGMVRPAEFAKDHLPAFVKGETPKRFFTVYPYVRLPEWYLLPGEDRSRILREHGEAGREYPDVLANTVSAFGLGDYEWILAFEADSPDRLVDLIRRLRATEARRYTKLEIPFYTGVRKELSELLDGLL
jgi:hydrogen peroxide-dependent heme synthase